MAISIYLAASPAQITKLERFPKKLAWMACHFSASSAGLSDCPRWLPPGSLLILDDSAPIQGHDPDQIRRELEDILSKFSCSALLLDFQRPGGEDMTLALAELPCPAVVTERYAHMTSGPVLLPPVPPYMLPGKHLKPWAGRDIWLELSKDSCAIRLTKAGAELSEERPDVAGRHHHKELHCSYDIMLHSEEAIFRLHRTPEDFLSLLQESEALGVTTAVGLMQEFPEFGQQKAALQCRAALAN